MKIFPLPAVLRSDAIRFVAEYEFKCTDLVNRLVANEGEAYAIVDRKNILCGIVLITKGGLLFHHLPFAYSYDDVEKKLLQGEAACLFRETFASKHIFCVIGETPGTEFILSSLTSGQNKTQIIPYILMVHTGPSERIVRKARTPVSKILRCNQEHVSSLYQLQAAYEQEEVLNMTGKAFNPSVCRLLLRNTLEKQYVFASAVCSGSKDELRFVSKAGTNAIGLKWAQLGGVYTLQEYRRQGYAFSTLSYLISFLYKSGKNSVLFVKKQNIPAQLLYAKANFSAAGNFEIAYL